MELVAGRMLDLVILILIWLSTVFFMFSKHDIWIRRLPAIDFIEESVGRASEMGKAVVVQGFGGSEGLESSSSPQIIAALSVLGYVARLCARRGTKLIATMRSQNVIPVADEVIRTAYKLEGKLDEYENKREEFLPYYPTQAACVALALREKPATHIMIGPFWHESVQLAEIYGRVGAVQIGGTARMSQVTFFAALCDMALIGEEIYALGAYISQTPQTISSIAIQDYFKLIGLGIIILGSILITINPDYVKPLIALLNW